MARAFCTNSTGKCFTHRRVRLQGSDRTDGYLVRTGYSAGFVDQTHSSPARRKPSTYLRVSSARTNGDQSSILALGVIEPRALVVDGKVEARPACTLSLSFDHRILDGAEAGRALKALKDLLESPFRLGSLPRAKRLPSIPVRSQSEL